MASGKKPVDEEEAGSNFDGGGDGEQNAGQHGVAAGVDQGGDGEDDKEDVRLVEEHGVAEGLAESKAEAEDGGPAGVEEERGPMAQQEPNSGSEGEQAEEEEELIEGGVVHAGAEGAEREGPERGLHVGVKLDLGREAGASGRGGPGRIVLNVEKLGVVVVEVVLLACGEHEAADIGGGEIFTRHMKILEEANGAEEDEDEQHAQVSARCHASPEGCCGG